MANPRNKMLLIIMRLYNEIVFIMGIFMYSEYENNVEA